MLNEFVSVVISGNEEHRKLMETTFLVRTRLPVALIEVPIFDKQGEYIRLNPGDTKGESCMFANIMKCICVCLQCVCVRVGIVQLFVLVGCVCIRKHFGCVFL